MDLPAAFQNMQDLPPPTAPLDQCTLPRGRGVCALLDGQGRLIVHFASENLRRALWQRLSTSDASPGRRTNLRAVAHRLLWTPTYSAFETAWAFLESARKLNPAAYGKELSFASVWFARIDPAAPFPHWQVSKTAFSGGGVEIGPFLTRKHARQFVDLLEDLFDLCRYYDILRQSPHGQACAYKQMGKCPAPCDGTVSLDVYRSAIGASVEFALGDSESRLAQLERDMQHAARSQEFERAAALREQIQRARKALACDGRIAHSPTEFRYLVIQKAEGIAQIKPFFVRQGAITIDRPVKIAHVTEAAKCWADKMCNPLPSPPIPPEHRCEHLAMVCHFVHRKDRAGGLFVPFSEASDSAALHERIIGRFQSKRGMKSSAAPNTLTSRSADR